MSTPSVSLAKHFFLFSRMKRSTKRSTNPKFKVTIQILILSKKLIIALLKKKKPMIPMKVHPRKYMTNFHSLDQDNLISKGWLNPQIKLPATICQWKPNICQKCHFIAVIPCLVMNPMSLWMLLRIKLLKPHWLVQLQLWRVHPVWNWILGT